MGAANCKIGLYCKTSPFIQNKLSNVFFITDLLENIWDEVKYRRRTMFKAKPKDLYIYKIGLYFKFDADLLAIAQEFALDNKMFLDQFMEAWTHLSNADRYFQFGLILLFPSSLIPLFL